MKERPILFSAPMVRAILSGRKTQTRREVKRCGLWESTGGQGMRPIPIACPHGRPGDRLWVRETWQYAPVKYCDCPQGSEAQPCDDWIEGIGCRSNRTEVIYREDEATAAKWRSPIHMPRWASRITLEITDIRVERLQEISDADAMAEGAAFTCPQCGNDLDDEHGAEVHAACDDPDMGSHGEGFRRIWTAINGSGSWDANPWVWVIEFRGVDS